MTYIHRLLLVSLVPCLSILLLVGCTPKIDDETSYPEDMTPIQENSQVESEPEVKQGQNNELNNDCATIKSELEATRAKYEELQSKYSELTSKHDGLSAEYSDLNAEYEELNAKYNTVIQGTAGITEGDVEQAIFESINQDRQNNGLSELEWTDTFYQWAKEHSDYMATRKRLELTEQPYWQDVFRAAGYSTLERIANAALIIWKESTAYETNFLNEQANYGVVAVSKSGEVFYITYFAHTHK